MKLPFIKSLQSITSDLKALRSDLRALRKSVETLGKSINIHTKITKDAAILLAQDAVLMTAPKYANEKSLTKYQSQVYSQNAEDGIIAEIFKRIGVTNKFYVEIGAENGIENNTRFLLQLGWKGVWIEGDKSNVDIIRGVFKKELDEHHLIVLNVFVTKENVVELMQKAEVPLEFDFLSIDIDMNTHHIWESLSEYRPRAACIEYNASIPPSVDYSVPYDPKAIWNDGSNYFGAGLKSLERIGTNMGYNLVGCDYLGVNAFFVRGDLCQDKFLKPYNAEFHYEPPRYSLTIHRGHKKYKSS
jgi:hypothetical protein